MLDLLTSPQALVYVAGGLYAIGYLIINQVILRAFVLVGTAFYILYYATVEATPLWEAIWVSVVLGTANLIGMASLFLRNSELAIPAEHRDIYPRFSGLPPGDFRALMSVARRYTTVAEQMLTEEGKPVDKLVYIISGATEVSKRGERFRLPPGLFLGEVAYLTGQPSAATTVLEPGSEILEWSVDELNRQAKRANRFKLALESMISRDLAVKVAVAVAPHTADEFRSVAAIT